LAEDGDTAKVDVDQACATLKQTVPLAQVLTTKRGVKAINQVRRQLAQYRDREAVRELEAVEFMLTAHGERSAAAFDYLPAEEVLTQIRGQGWDVDPGSVMLMSGYWFGATPSGSRASAEFE